MKTTGLRELKAHLSRYLRAAAQGERLVVTFRGKPLVEVRAAPGGEHDPLAAQGFRPAERPNDRRWADRRRYGLGDRDVLHPGEAQALLDAERG